MSGRIVDHVTARRAALVATIWVPLAIVAAERILGLAPKGTHDWKKFIKHEEAQAQLKEAGFEIGRLSGMVLKPLMGVWSLSDRDLSINYILSAEAA